MAPDTEQIVIVNPGPPAIVQELSPIVQAARAFDVVDVETNGEALERLKRLRHGRKMIDDHFHDAIQDAHRAHKRILSSVAALTGPIKEAERIYDRKADAYEREERRKAEEKERELREKARKEEEERQLMAAIEAEESGNKEEAEAILEEKVEAPVVQVAPQTAKVQGVSRRTTWAAEITDVDKCLTWLIGKPEWAATRQKLIPILETAFRPLATAQHEALAIPGVRAVSQTVRSARG